MKTFLRFSNLCSSNASQPSITFTHWLLIALAILMPLACHGTLDTGEKEALHQLFVAYPALAHVPKWYENDIYGRFLGGAWSDNYDNLCLEDGYGYHGVYCKMGHVDGLHVTSHWASPISTNFSLIGLQYLKNFTVSSDAIQGPHLTSLVKFVANNLEPVELISESTEIWVSWFFSPHVVERLSGNLVIDIPMTNFTSLRYLGSSLLPSNVSMLGSAILTNLEELVVKKANITWLSESISLFTSLKHLSILSNFVIDTTGRITISSSTLISLKMVITNSIALESVVVISNSLEHLDLELLPYIAYDFNTLNLKSFALRGPSFEMNRSKFYPSLPSMLSQWNRLESLTLSKISAPSDEIPNLDFSPFLKQVSISYFTKLTQLDFNRIICSLVSGSTPIGIETLAFIGIEDPGASSISIPACLARSTTLKSFQWDGRRHDLTLAPPVSSKWEDVLPLALTQLSIISPANASYTYSLANIQSFKMLKTLDIQDTVSLVGTIPDNFFESLPLLKHLKIISSLNGSIPSTGWGHLEDVNLSGRFTSWFNMDPAPNLKTLKISSDALKTFPHDRVFQSADLRNLRELSVRTLLSLGGPIPTFWMNLPRLEVVSLDNNGFEGPLIGSITAPNLHHIGINSNRLCGSLPIFSLPKTIENLMVSNNRFSGTIPTSWADNLSVISMLRLEKNSVNGSIPLRLSRPNGFHIPSIIVSETDISGPLWDIPIVSISYVDVPLDLCNHPPQLPVGAVLTHCNFRNVARCPSTGNCSNEWDFCPSDELGECTERNFVPREVDACITPPPRPLPPTFCPQPSPSGFICVNGIWTSTGNVSESTITLPPNSGVIVVNGSLSTSGSIVFNGLGSQIEVRDCVSNLPAEIVIEIGGDEKLHGTTLLSQKGSNCTNDLSVIPVRLQTSGESCKRTKVSTSTSTRSSLAVTFTVDSSRCNVKWIVLGSVVGGVTILIVATLILLNSFSPKFSKLLRKCLR